MSDKITSARITPMPKSLFDPMPTVYVVINGVEQKLFDYYPDEISFSSNEFIGLTLEEARALKGAKDRAYLRS